MKRLIPFTLVLILLILQDDPAYPLCPTKSLPQERILARASPDPDALGRAAPFSSRQSHQYELDKALLDAIENGDEKKVAALLSQGASVNAKGINDTALQTALFYQHVEIARLLLAQGARIEALDLSHAVHGSLGDKEKASLMVKLVLSFLDKQAVAQGKRGADLTIGGAAAIRDAAFAGNLEVLRLFLARGAPVNGKDENGEGVLMNVVRLDRLDAIEVLLDAGADIKALDDRGMTILMNTARADYRSDVGIRVRLLKLLLSRGADVHARDSDGRTALHYSVEQVMSEGGGFRSHPEIVELLLASGADVNAKDKRGKTALMDAAQIRKGTLDIPRLLLEKGADVNLSTQEGVTALMFAAANGNNELAQLFLERGALIDAKDKLGRTAIVHGTEAGEPDVVGLLTNKGADLSLTPYKTEAQLKAALHNSALLKAVSYGRIADAKQLLESGADVNARSRTGGTALIWAADGYKNDIVELLITKGAEVNATDDQNNTALMFASRANNREAVKFLLDHKAEPNRVNKEGKTALLLAAEGGHTQVAELLLAAGADHRARNAAGQTALLAACDEESAQDELVQLLLAKGADSKVVDSLGNTSLMLAARSDAFQVIKTLLAGGVDVNAKNKDGFTALKLAQESQRKYPEARAEVIRLLLAAGAK